MASVPPPFATVGSGAGKIDVLLSYKIVELFSEGLYASPNKAIEELVTNSFDAGARRVHVLLPPNMHEQTATIAIVDDGEGMDAAALKQHWLIGISGKRKLAVLPQGRQQIGKFGIGKLATYVLAGRLTHVSKRDGKYYSTSMNYDEIDRRIEDVEPKKPLTIPLRTLTEAEAKQAVSAWTNTKEFKNGEMPLFGRRAPESWTVAIMSSLKPKVHEIKPGMLEWVLRTALPLRADFELWQAGRKLEPSKQGKGRLKKWTLGKDLVELGKPSPKGISASIMGDKDAPDHFGLDVPGLGRITGYAEVYKDLLTTGKSADLGRSYGFFVYVFGRLVNEQDGHFGISPNELRHGTFGRFRAVLSIDALDKELRSNRESVREGPALAAAQDVLRAIFNAARQTLEKHDVDEEPGAKLGRRVAGSPASLSRRPIVELARAVLSDKAKSRYLILPEKTQQSERNSIVDILEKRVNEPDTFIAGRTIDYDGAGDDGIARYDTLTGILRINAWHPLVASFHDEFVGKSSGHPLELFAMAEVLLEAHLHTIGVKQAHVDELLGMRDQLLRNLANESGGKSAFAVAKALLEARNSPDALESKVCEAFTSLGFEVVPIGGNGKPDGVATALLSGATTGQARQYKISLEAKSKEKDTGKVSAQTVGVSRVARHRDDYNCHHAVVVGRAFPTSKGDESAIAKEIADDRTKTALLGDPRTVTLITIDALAKLVRLRPSKQIGLAKIRELLEKCGPPEETDAWISDVEKTVVKKPPYKQIVNTIQELQKKRTKAVVQYSALAVELSHLTPKIEYDSDDELREICRSLAQFSRGGLRVTGDAVELDTSAANVIAEIESAMKEEGA